MRAHSLLVVPLPGLTAVMPPLQVEPTPHVVLVEPFTGVAEMDPGVITELAAFFADVLPFTVLATRTAKVGAGTAYLTLDQPATFQRLRHELLRHFPELPGCTGPVSGTFPYLVVRTAPDAAASVVRTALEPHLPASVHAAEAALWWRDGAEVRTLERFPFARTAA